jgi:hypothetical protein
MHKNTSLLTGTRTAVIHNYQPQAQILYILLSVLATIIETLSRSFSKELFISATQH